MGEISEIYNDIVHLKTDMAQINVLVERLDVAIVKLTEVSSSVTQLLAVQGNRLDQQKETNNHMNDLIEKRKEEIEKAKKDFKEEMEKLNNKIIHEMQLMREEFKGQHNTLSKKISDMEKWRWIVTGGALVVGFLLSKAINVGQFFN